MRTIRHVDTVTQSTSPTSDATHSSGPRVSAAQRSPKISVLMAVFNCEPYLREAVQSILDQTCGDFELIIVDDGSTDASCRIMDEFASQDSRIRTLRVPHGGRAAALNRAMETARGEYLAPMDADDIAFPERLATELAYLEAHPQCAVVGGQVERVDADGRSLGWMDGLGRSHEEIDAGLLHYGWPLVFGGAMVRASAQRAAGAYDVSLRTNQDHEMLLRLAEHGQLANIEAPAIRYRQHPQSNLARHSNSRESGYMMLVDIVRRARRRRGLGPDVDAEVECAQRRAWWALESRDRRTAWRHARTLLRYRPFQPGTWRLIACTLRGY